MRLNIIKSVLKMNWKAVKVKGLVIVNVKLVPEAYVEQLKCLHINELRKL